MTRACAILIAPHTETETETGVTRTIVAIGTVEIAIGTVEIATETAIRTVARTVIARMMKVVEQRTSLLLLLTTRFKK